MEEFFARVWTDLISRVQGPMHARLLVQPLVACIFAVRSGMRDVREHKPPFFWSQAFLPDNRDNLRRQAWKDIGKLLIVIVILDVIYQFIRLHMIYPGEAIIVALLLAVIPYMVVRSAVTRIAGLKEKQS